MPGKSFEDAYSGAHEDNASSRRAARKATKRFDIGDGVVGNIVSGFAGVMDNIPFLDELVAFRAMGTPGNVMSYDQNLDFARSFAEEAEEANPNFYLGGQIAGALAPGGGALKVGKLGKVGQAALGGAAYGGLYGLGKGEDLDERLSMAGSGALFGGVGGWLIAGSLSKLAPVALEAGEKLVTRLKVGRSPRLDPALMPANPIGMGEELAPALAGAGGKRGPKAKPLIDPDVAVSVKSKPSVMDELEEGALVTVREMLGDPGAAAQAVAKRLGKLSPQQAEDLLKDFVKSEADGSALTNVHFRSLMRLDMTATKHDPEVIVRAATIFNDAIEALAERAGQKSRTVKGMDQQVADALRRGVTLDGLKEAYEKSVNGFQDVRIAQFTMFTAAAKIVRLREELLPDILKGVEGSREKLAEELTDAAHRLVYAKGIMSNAGRNLGILSHGTQARLVDIADDAYGLDAGQVAERVKAALGKLDDDDLKDLLSRIRTMADAEALERILLDEAEAQAFSVWRKAGNSVAMFLRSNALTPATFFFNMASYVLTSGFRGAWSKELAARRLERAGQLDDAMMLRIETQLTRSVRWKARKEATTALLNRIKWEFWDDVERVFATEAHFGGTLSAKARLKKSTMLQGGYAPPSLREARAGDNPAARLTVNADAAKDWAGFSGLMARLGAVGVNALDAAGGFSMKLFTGAADDFGRAHTRITETYAQAARQAFREAKALNKSIDELPAWVDRRAKELAEMPTAEMMARVERDMASLGELTDESKFFVELQKLVEKEADERLYMDGPQTELGKASANWLEKIDKWGVVFPYVRTPIRLFERGLVDYGPFAARSAQNRKILEAGGVEAEILKARMDIGMQTFNAGIALGLAGAVTATNGGYKNSANLDAGPPNRFNFFGNFIEIGRLDPFSLTVGMGAMFGQMLRDGYEAGAEYEKSEVLRAMLSTAFHGAEDVILSKSYLKSLKELTDAFSASSEEEMTTRAGAILGNAASRLVPLGGITRQVKETFRTSAVEAVTFGDQILRTIPFAGWGMAPKIDVLGDEVKARHMGINFGDSGKTEGEPISPVKAELRRLGIDINTIRKSDPDGFDLTSEELSEVRRIRGKEARDKLGRTMEEALHDLFSDPWFQSLSTKDQKRTEVVETMKAFNQPAWEILAERRPEFAAKKAYRKSFVDYMAQGQFTEREAKNEAVLDVEYQGLPTNHLE